MHHDRDGRDIQQLLFLIQDTAVAMFVTAARARPLPMHPVPFDGTLWFLASSASGLVAEIGRRPGVLLTFAHPAGQSHVALRGAAREQSDAAMLASLWRPGLQAWFPGGPGDPDLRLVRVTVEQAEFWDTPSAAGRTFRFGPAEVSPDDSTTGEDP